ncbi:MAG TPA: hypothetical protein VK718_12500 [Ferruginibacter sp.]|jgi:hypothetical protein|nr:hypothetical protein [Ferruginibacter sp.]
MKTDKELPNVTTAKKTADLQIVIEPIKKKSCCKDKKCTNKCAEEIVNVFKHMDGLL